ncbi:MAG: hypothetical protein MZV70_36250 [Desulfobacterales bacterium]|nr:hypothetical protein [Desulfobacterales bacterium]
MIFDITSTPLNKPDEIKTNAEIWAEEDARVERDGTERQRLAKQALMDIRKAVPLEDQGLLNEFMSQMVLMPEDQDLSLRRMAEELGVNRETLRRHIKGIVERIQETVTNNPEYYDAFVKEARSIKDYWDDMARQRKEQMDWDAEKVREAPEGDGRSTRDRRDQPRWRGIHSRTP